MENDAWRTSDCLARSLDQFLSGLAEHLNGDVFRNEPLVYDLSNKIKIRL